MLAWFAETTVVAIVLAAAVTILGRWLRLGPVPRHTLWLVVLLRLITPPVLAWPQLPLPLASLAPMPPRPVLDPTSEECPLAPAVQADRWARVEVVRSRIESSSPDVEGLARAALLAWPWITLALVARQVVRILRFRRRLRRAVPAPDWLVAEALRIGDAMGTTVPEVLVVPGLSTPMIWFLSSPKLVLPAGLVKSLGPAGWRGVLAHELAHLHRRDHWVRRLELLAGLLWWWNPLYWVTCHRLEADAELACDEWATSLFPKGRLDYAEALLEVCRCQSVAGSPAPALGVAGPGRLLERRVIMILRDQTPSRASAGVLFTALLLALLAFPSWGASSEAKARPMEVLPGGAGSTPLLEDRTVADDDQDADDDDDDDDRIAEILAKLAAKKKKVDGDAIDPQAQKKLEQLSKDLEAKFGKSSKFAKELEEKFGKDSKFAKEMAEKFGPGSEFEKKIKKIAAEADAAAQKAKKAEAGLEAKPAAEADVAAKVEAILKAKRASEADADAKVEAILKAKRAAEAEAAAKALNAKKKVVVDDVQEKDREKIRRIEELQAQIEKLSAELKAIKAEIAK
jgi:beta-lactamase regulating signal transducer with metallopeptidase domain